MFLTGVRAPENSRLSRAVCSALRLAPLPCSSSLPALHSARTDDSEWNQSSYQAEGVKRRTRNGLPAGWLCSAPPFKSGLTCGASLERNLGYVCQRGSRVRAPVLWITPSRAWHSRDWLLVAGLHHAPPPPPPPIYVGVYFPI